MRISDWSSDVCSSDLPAYRVGIVAVAGEECQRRRHPVLELDPVEPAQRVVHRLGVLLAGVIGIGDLAERLRHRQQHLVDEGDRLRRPHMRSEEHTSELQSLMRISYAVFCLKKKKNNKA